MKCLLSQNERDFLDAVIHLHAIGQYRTSDRLIMMNSGLNDNQITRAKRNVVALDLLSVQSNSKRLGCMYCIHVDRYNQLLERLNEISDAVQRFTTGDAIRKECGLPPIFTNIIHRLARIRSGTEGDMYKDIPQNEPSPDDRRQALKRRYENKEITLEEYRTYLKRI